MKTPPYLYLVDTTSKGVRVLIFESSGGEVVGQIRLFTESSRITLYYINEIPTRTPHNTYEAYDLFNKNNNVIRGWEPISRKEFLELMKKAVSTYNKQPVEYKIDYF